MFDNLLRSVHGKDWAQFLDYISPTFFEVVPTLEIARLSTQMGRNFAKRHHSEEEEATRALIHVLGLPVEFRNDKDSCEMLPSLSRRERGHIVLSLFFGQILGLDKAWLDLRLSTFEMLSRECIWKPLPWIMEWDHDFLWAIRDSLYGLFQDDRERFTKGMDALRLGQSADFIFDQLNERKAVHFSLKNFRETLHVIFMACKNAKIKIHSNFFPLALLVASMWEHLDRLDESYHVHSVFHSVVAALEHEKHGTLREGSNG